MDLKSKLAAAMNRAKQSPMDGGDKKEEKKIFYFFNIYGTKKTI